MKKLLLSVSGLLMLTACMEASREPVYVYAQPPVQPQQQVQAQPQPQPQLQEQVVQPEDMIEVVDEVTVLHENPYALKKGPAYDDSRFVYDEKEKQLFRMESDLLNAQQELYDRERQLANREAEFLAKSKSLYQKEKMLEERAQSLSTAAPARYVPEPRLEEPRFVEQRQRPILTSAPASYPAPTVAPEPPCKKSKRGHRSQPATGTVTKINSSVIIMEHPIQRDLVRCSVSDDTCLRSYERLGYVRSPVSNYSTPDDVAAVEEQGKPDLAWW